MIGHVAHKVRCVKNYLNVIYFYSMPKRKSTFFKSALAFALLLIILLSTYYRQKRATGRRVHFKSKASCSSPADSVAFIKNHKCGSSSIQNVLFRYGDTRNLSFVLPIDKSNYLGHPVPFHRSFVFTIGDVNMRTFNILAIHTRFDYLEIKSVMTPNAPFITILRDPVTLFESLYVYCGLDQYGMDLQTFAANAAAALSTDHFPGHFVPFNYNRRFQNGKIGRNQMSFDLGLDVKYFDNETIVKQFIAYLDDIFSLVMITERIDESLILMKDLLCWSIEDVIVFKHNSRQEMFRIALQEHDRNNVRRINHADQLLYVHFRTKFDLKVVAFGEDRMKREVQLLQKKTRDLYAKCVEREEPVDALKVWKYWASSKTVWLKPRINNDRLCSQLTMQELPYCDRLQNKTSGDITIDI